MEKYVGGGEEDDVTMETNVGLHTIMMLTTPYEEVMAQYYKNGQDTIASCKSPKPIGKKQISQGEGEE